MSLLSEDIGKRMKAQELASTAQDLARNQERLMDSLDKLQSGDKNLDAIMKQIADMAQIADGPAAGDGAVGAADARRFYERRADAGARLGPDVQALDEIRKKLQAGDIEGARQLARELFNQMAQMVAAMQNMQRSQMASSMGRMQGEMQRQTSELQEIAREQQEILVNTENLNSAGLTERDAALKSQAGAVPGPLPSPSSANSLNCSRTAKDPTIRTCSPIWTTPP